MVKIIFAKLCRKLLFFDTLICLLLGLLLYFFPKFVGDFTLQRSTDGVHWHLLRCIGGHLLASTFFSRSSGSTHSTALIRSACIVMRLLSGVLCSFIFLHTLTVHPNLIHPQFDKVKPSEIYPERTAIQGIHGALYQLDTIAAVSIGLAWISSPEWLLNRQLHIRSHSDLAIAAETRALLCIFILSAQIWSQIAYTKDWSGKHWIGISLFSTWTGIAIIYRLYLWTSRKSQIYLKQNRELINDGIKKKHN
uniref:PAP2 superfamily protein n=1 Tax=Meloidogyne hapla TaxID=6305 RepID=A0A1I8BN37_MELHA